MAIIPETIDARQSDKGFGSSMLAGMIILLVVTLAFALSLGAVLLATLLA